LPALERADIPKAWSLYFNGLGLLMHRKGDPAAARVHYERALSYGQAAGAEPLALAILTNLTDATWTLGDLDAALAAQLEVIARLRKSPRARKITVGICFTNLAGIHVERGELDAALAAAREGLPLLKELGLVWYPLDHHALRVAMAGKVANAALLAGFADCAHTARTMSREPNEARAHERLQALLRSKLAPDELERLLEEGSKISEDEACRLALED
jgi:tetratricopeptide (TPR) repeat protein